MLVASRLPLWVPDLDEIRDGAIRLTVPLVDDVIQIGLGGRYDVGSIDVLKWPAGLLVRRTDGRPLQARIIRDEPVTVLRAPVPRLALRRVGPGWWLARDAMPAGRMEDLGQLVRTIAIFGLAKQSGATTSAAI
ncbi:uncharacterized protein RMCC_0925 [Mycolicibacterium canariasense]|uniref:Uncharacterized protein n=1 Tax=Mycolicibacterium canariasense TaxID=228230 RepID=A0A100W8Y1_MYCCR|nr:hypothetical protein [Mycolicibacterium canariasense]MCV7213209.1 hypothetical protein [Mycolicibacterium canariasense]ORV18389.1 hypothetical protein AWB94_33525 [Mycolicibacterium canariasense]GAS93959.1 uncharacterized protein RMCC_0925 [Mycolicibacterium canariasense]